MKNLKKVLALLVVFTMMLSTVAFAASEKLTSDISDANVKIAVERLAAFGIVGGKDDGLYHPEDNLTREEFAKLVVEALGLGPAAAAGQGSSQFADVQPERWSAGYISVAAGQGIITGIGDGMFGPEQPVTYAQALTMLVRALGYQDSFLRGVWPSNYIAKAAELKLTTSVNSTTGTVDRGAAAIMINNTLDKKIVKQTSCGDENSYQETDITLLEDKLKITKYEDATITAIPRVDSGLNEDEIKFEWYDDDDDLQVEKFESTAAMDYNYLLGVKADLYVNDDDELFYAEVKNKDFTVYYDVIDKGEEVSEDEITLIKADDDFSFADDYTIYIGNRSQSIKALADAVEATSGNGLFAKVVLDKNNKVVLVDAYEANELETVVVKNVNTSAQVIEYFVDTEDLEEIDLEDGPDAYLVFNAEGKEISLSDIEEDDVIFISEADNRSTKDTEWYVFVSSEKAEGTLEKYKASKVTVDGEEYDLSSPMATISLDEDKNVEEVNDSKLEDASDENVVLLLDFEGKVRHIRTDAEETSDTMYGVLVKADTGMEDKVKIFNSQGEEIIYVVDDVDDGVSVSSYNRTNRVAGVDSVYLVEYTVDKHGEINSLYMLAEIPVSAWNDSYADPADTYFNNVASGNVGSYHATSNAVKKSSLAGASGSETVDSSVAVFNLGDYIKGGYDDTDDIELITWDDATDESGFVRYVYATNDKGRVTAVFFLTGMEAVGDDVYAGYIIDEYKKSGDQYAEIAVYGEKIADYEIDTKKMNGRITDETIVVFRLNADGVIKDGTVEGEQYSYDNDYGIEKNLKVESKSGRYLKFEGVTGQYYVPNDAVIYDEDDVKALYNVAVGEYVNIAYESRNALVIKILGDKPGETGGGVNTDLADAEFEFTSPTNTSILVTITNDVYFTEDAVYRIRVTNLDEDTIVGTYTSSAVVGDEEKEVEFTGVDFASGTAYYKIELFQGIYSADKVIATEPEFRKNR